MAKISALPPIPAPTGTETVVVLDNGVTRRAVFGSMVGAAVAPSVAQAAASAQASGDNLQLIRALRLSIDAAIANGGLLPPIVINGQGLVFDTIGAAQLATIPAGTKRVDTLGFYAAHDGGKASYRPVPADPGVGACGWRSADGQWWKLIDSGGTINRRQAGARCNAVWTEEPFRLVSGDDDRQAIEDCIRFLTVVPGTILYAAAARIQLDFGMSYISGGPWNLHKRIEFVGLGCGRLPAGTYGVSGFVFDGGHCSIYANARNTNNGQTIPVDTMGGSAEGCRFFQVDFVQLSNAFTKGANLIQAHIPIDIDRCTFNGSGDTAVYSNTTSGGGGATEGNANRGSFTNSQIKLSWGDGMNFAGADGNCWTIENIGVHQAKRVGARFNPYFATRVASLLVNNYGNRGVYQNGRAWYLRTADPNGAEPGKDNGVFWGDLGSEYVPNGPSNAFPQWRATDDHFLQVPVYSPGNATSFDELYVEGQLIPCVIGGFARGTFEAEQGVSGGWMSANVPGGAGNGAIVVQRGIGTFAQRLRGEKAVNMGSSAFAFVGNMGYASVGVHVLQFGRDKEGGAWTWDQVGPRNGADQAFGYSGSQTPTFVVTGKNTSYDFGSGTPRPYQFGTADLGLFNFQDYYHSILGARQFEPRGPVGQGSIYFNQDSRVGTHLLWRVVTGGIAGSTAVFEKIRADPAG